MSDPERWETAPPAFTPLPWSVWQDRHGLVWQARPDGLMHVLMGPPRRPADLDGPITQLEQYGDDQ